MRLHPPLRAALLAVIALFGAALASADLYPLEPRNVRSDRGAGQAVGVDIAPNGDSYVAYHDGGGHAIARLDRNGDQIWSYGWGNPAGAWLYEEHVAATPSGGAVLTGTLTAQNYSYSKIVLRRLAANGTVERYAEWSFPNSTGTYGYSFTPDGKGGFWLGGNYSRNETSSSGVLHHDSDLYVAHFNADLGGSGGVAVPDRVYSVSGNLSGPSGDDPANESVGELRCFPDGTVILLYGKEGGATANLWTTAIKPDGSRRTIPLGPTGDANVYSVVKGGVAWDGANVIVASGVRQPDGSHRATLRKFGFDGTLRWSASPEAAGADAYLASVDVTPAGNVVAGGFNTVPGLDREFRVYRYTPAGALFATHGGLGEFGDYARASAEYCETVRASTVDEAVIAVGRWFAPNGTLPGYVGPPNAFTGSIQIAEIQPDGASYNWVWGSGARNLPGGIQTTSNGRLALAITLGDTPVLWPFRRFKTPAADQYSVQNTGPVSIAAPGVLANDAFLDDFAGIEYDDVTAHGRVALKADGSFVYTPNAGYRGTDTFRYRLLKRNGPTALFRSDWTTVSVHQNTPPLIAYDHIDTFASEPVEFNPLDNDGVETGEPLLFVSVDAPASGTLTRAGSVLRYTPRPGFVGEEVVEYRISDGIDVAIGKIYLRVLAGPTITGLSTKSVLAGSTAFDLTVYGTEFRADAKVLVNGVARATRFVSSTSVKTWITADDVAQAGLIRIQVRTLGRSTGSMLLEIRAGGTLAWKGNYLNRLPNGGLLAGYTATAVGGPVGGIRVTQVTLSGVDSTDTQPGPNSLATGSAITFGSRFLSVNANGATSLTLVVSGTADGKPFTVSLRTPVR